MRRTAPHSSALVNQRLSLGAVEEKENTDHHSHGVRGPDSNLLPLLRLERLPMATIVEMGASSTAVTLPFKARYWELRFISSSVRAVGQEARLVSGNLKCIMCLYATHMCAWLYISP